MTAITEVHERYGGLLTTRGGRRVVAHYGRPERTYEAVRNVAGAIEHGFGVVRATGPGRRAAVEAAVTNELPTEDGRYAFVLEEGTILADGYVFVTGESILGFVPGDRAREVAAAWDGSDVTVSVETRSFGVFGVYGPKATEKVGSVTDCGAPEGRLSVRRGSMRDAGVTVVRDDDLIGDVGYLIVAHADDAAAVFDTLVNHGLTAAPFGYEVWETLTLEAGTPLFETELRDATPASVGVTAAYPQGAGPDGTDVHLAGFTAQAVPDRGATIYADGHAVGTVTRARESPILDEPVGLATLDPDGPDDLRLGPDRIPATRESLPFVQGSTRSARVPGGP